MSSVDKNDLIVNFHRLLKIRTGGDTERCHGIRHQGSYSVAYHTYGVLCLLYVLFPDDFPRLAPYALFHDVPEAWVGDIPAPTKRYNAEVRTAVNTMERAIFSRLSLPSDLDLSPEDGAKVKACDQLELWFWAREQMEAGNKHASCVATELERYFVETPLIEPARSFFETARYRSVEHSTLKLIKDINE